MASNGRPDNQMKSAPRPKGGWERLIHPIKPPKSGVAKRSDGLVVRPILAR